MKRPKYLEHMDIVQDAIEHSTKINQGIGLSMKGIMKKTGLTYCQVQQATVLLREKGRVQHEYWGRTLVFTKSL